MLLDTYKLSTFVLESGLRDAAAREFLELALNHPPIKAWANVLNFAYTRTGNCINDGRLEPMLIHITAIHAKSLFNMDANFLVRIASFPGFAIKLLHALAGATNQGTTPFTAGRELKCGACQNTWFAGYTNETSGADMCPRRCREAETGDRKELECKQDGEKVKFMCGAGHIFEQPLVKDNDEVLTCIHCDKDAFKVRSYDELVNGY